MVLNARYLAKPDAAPALYAELSNNNIDICFVSESWLSKIILSLLICPEGYVMVRKDRAGSRIGSGVGILFVRTTGRLKRWMSRIAWNLSLYGAKWHTKFRILCGAYLSFPWSCSWPCWSPWMSDTCDQILADDPNASIIIAGDINHFNIEEFMRQQATQQLIMTPTWGERILDVFHTNCPFLWKNGIVDKGLVRSDHLAVIASPLIPGKPSREFGSFRPSQNCYGCEVRAVRLVRYPWLGSPWRVCKGVEW